MKTARMKHVAALATVAMLLAAGCGKEVVKRPTVTIDELKYDPTAQTLSVKGTVTDDGGELTDAGICWDTDTREPTVSNNKRSVGTNKSFSTKISNLPSRTIYLRAYANNRAGTGYSEAAQFPSVPILSKPTISGSTMSCDVLDNGGLPITECGFKLEWHKLGEATKKYERASTSVINETNATFEANWYGFGSSNGGFYYVKGYASNGKYTGESENATVGL